MNATEKRIIDEVLATLEDRSGRLRAMQAESPLGLHMRALRKSLTAIVYPRYGRFLVQGVRSFNGHGEIEIEEISSGGRTRSTGAFDSSSYSLNQEEPREHFGYYRAPWGWISKTSPLEVRFGALGYPSVMPSLKWTLYGLLEIEAAHGKQQCELEAKWAPEPGEDQDRVLATKPSPVPVQSLWPNRRK